MNTQEREQLNQFLHQLVEVKLTEKNGEAENIINDALSRQPDASYLLVQRCLLQDQALQAAQAQITSLQQQLQQKTTASANNGFLNNNPWATATNKGNGVPGAPDYRIPSSSAQDTANYSRTAPQYQTPGFGSSFLGNVATTAAGVVAGSFLFQGIGNLLGHHTSPSPWNQTSGEEHLAEQTVINNYYGDDTDQLAQNESIDDQFASNDYENLMDDSDFDSDWV